MRQQFSFKRATKLSVLDFGYHHGRCEAPFVSGGYFSYVSLALTFLMTSSLSQKLVLSHLPNLNTIDQGSLPPAFAHPPSASL